MLSLALFATFCCALLMFALWLVHFPLRNAAIVDAGWSLGIPLCAAVYALQSPEGWPPRAWILVAMTTLWGLRLGGYLLFTRVFGHPEEGRYQTLRAKWKTHIGFKFLLFYEVQALLCGILSVPFLLASVNPTPSFSPLELLGIALWLTGWLGESLADWQLWTFKSTNPPGRACRTGLWRYSRHPNYFFEWIVWIGWALYALPAPHGYWALTAPCIMYFFLTRVTGIRPTEEQALRTKGADYVEYQRTTNAFFPWFPVSKTLNASFHGPHKNS